MISNFKGKKTFYRRIFITVIMALILKLFIINIFFVPSKSMEPKLLVGDIILVNKINFGARIINLVKLFKEKKKEYIRLSSTTKIYRNDIIVFNYPDLTGPDPFGVFFVKRCYGLPKDTVRINLTKKNKLNLSNQGCISPIFPNDTSIFKWTSDSLGPILVPAKGTQIELTRKNVALYENIINFENRSIYKRDTSLYINNYLLRTYTFKNNYYFMLGDNFSNSFDSRYWGFVPDSHLIGKVSLIILSINSHKTFFKKIRWKRFFISPK